MIYILLAVAFSVTVSVLLKLARRADIDIVQAVATNYIVAAGLAMWLLGATPQAALQSDARTPLILLGILLPAIFVMLARSVSSAGIVRTDVAQRLSLFLSLAAAFLLFGEPLVPLKILGIVLALVAVACILWRKERKERMKRAGWLAPLAVFTGFGAIDICFKLIAQAHAPFPSALLASFLIALVLCWIAVIVRAVTHQASFSLRSIGFGVVLGAANFANILFYIRGHQALPNDPSLVFASMNLGVVLLGAMIGALAFREKLSWLNWTGLAVAVAAIGVMTIA